MFTFLVNAISLIVLICSYLLFKRAAGSMSLWRLNMISFIFYVFIFLMTFIGAVLVVNELDHHYLIDKLQDEKYRFYGWLSVMYTMIALPIGILSAKFILSRRTSRQILESYIDRPIQPLLSKNDRNIRYILYSLSFISFFAIVYTIIYTGEIPLFNFIKGASLDTLMQQRILSGRNFQGNEYIKNIFGITFTPILTLISFSYLKQSDSFSDKLWFYSMFVLSAFILIYDLQKAPLIMFIVGMVMLQVLSRKQLNKRKILSYFFLAGGLLLLSYVSLSQNFGSSTLTSYNSGILGRIFLSGMAGLFHAFEIFPEQHPFVGFSSMSSLFSNLLDVEYQERSARIIMEHLNPDGIKKGTAGVINSFFIAESWANFGLPGVLLSPFYVGLLIGLLYYLLLLSKKTPLFLGIYGYFSYQATLIGGFNDYIYNAGFFITVIVIFTSILFASAGMKNALRRVS